MATGSAADSTLSALLHEGIEEGIYTGAAAAIGSSHGITWNETAGVCDPQTGEPVRPETRFDIASVTKAVVTTTVVLRLVERGAIGLAAPIREYVPPLAGSDRGDIPVRHFLTHTSGLTAYHYDHWESKSEAISALYDTSLLEGSPGEQFIYSCLNFVHLADAVCRVTGTDLECLASRYVFEPAGMARARIGPLESTSGSVAVTYDHEHADCRLTGEIHDPIARACSGESGNSGLFATVSDLSAFAETLLSLGQSSDDTGLLTKGTYARMRENWLPHLERPHGLGWRMAHDCEPAANWSRQSFGHTGYTGTSMWIDPTADRFSVLLTNAVYCGKGNGMERLRERFHGAAARVGTTR